MQGSSRTKGIKEGVRDGVNKTMLEFLSLIWHCEVSEKREKYVMWLGSLCFVVGKWCKAENGEWKFREILMSVSSSLRMGCMF